MDALLKELPLHQGLARVFGAIGEDGFWRALIDTLRLLVPMDNALVAVIQPGRVPRLLIDFDSKGSGEHEDLADYCAGMYLLDPFYLAVCAGIADGLHSLDSVAPDQFQQSEYYLSYFRSVVGGDELQFMINVDGAVLGLSLGRSARFTLEEQGRLLCVRDWVLAAMRRHLQLLPPQGPVAESVAGDLATLLDRFDARLSVREIETARLILQGFSSKAIAQQMGISPETVKVHRRNLYHKLNVNGHGELFALVLQPR
ncbi:MULTISPECIES: LuxR C-terminal-related transcriptional regulator [Pseudomonas]|uniref:Helix-turn-helix transcriptional regulator n=1 Tax=Pseudomonas izuensis TaxID=2684212 RepID=A0ABM7RVX5_9PSED|nr:MULTISPECIES: LuxR C-terminal-related transcriptional regulator [Pseudomonas]RKS24731.1 LuxR family transcriptional regulator [Pseudomonas sp. WPR_5_2]BCX69189.1 helix-turn-helix transcriptional regulator [Pseudomonas izuensis]